MNSSQYKLHIVPPNYRSIQCLFRSTKYGIPWNVLFLQNSLRTSITFDEGKKIGLFQIILKFSEYSWNKMGPTRVFGALIGKFCWFCCETSFKMNELRLFLMKNGAAFGGYIVDNRLFSLIVILIPIWKMKDFSFYTYRMTYFENLVNVMNFNKYVPNWNCQTLF